MKVVEIFNSIEGEGIRAGMPCTFIRLRGCNLKCEYCDSRYACDADEDYEILSIQQIVGIVKKYKCPNVTVTGGEPLIQPGIEALLGKLITEGYYVNVETNGSKELPILTDSIRSGRIIYTVDYKTNASGMTKYMKDEVFNNDYVDKIVKFVVGSAADLEQSLQVVEKYNIKNPFVSPVFGKIEASEIVDFIKEHELWDWRVQLQLHKYIWDPMKRGV